MSLGRSNFLFVCQILLFLAKSAFNILQNLKKFLRESLLGGKFPSQQISEFNKFMLGGIHKRRGFLGLDAVLGWRNLYFWLVQQGDIKSGIFKGPTDIRYVLPYGH